MGIIGTILIGLVVGLLARWLHPGHDRLGLIMTALLGIAGSVLATFAGQALGLIRMGQPAGFLGALIGAVVILFVYTRIKR
ncbi:GlsB/YeaQ/YmgE family stress response membrane protein [Denitromonas iodatirespirans]|uniref:GlsB/YeaQ/YmgE family stress response membrane protein n=1 Tax=Denitromonas iodatirespirans TaxID=2795389 RepID=A0A944DCQ2_DENI1|nr:GlsB/YeaQ/YmgE family stress response membrane protein [Denitromonas iodatirespirans]MBT0961952.1 GlsB/YeaQ/YmgE family stress response membrane protein [Denitromonas iodatirespirans]